MQGREFCRTHGGRYRKSVRVKHLPTIYSKFLRDSLAELIETQLGASSEKQLAVHEELAVMRATAVDTCKLYDASSSAQASTRLAAGDMLRSTMAEIIKAVEAAVRIQTASKETLSVHNLSFVIDQMVRIAHEVFGSDHAKAREFERLVRETLKVDSGAGTRITPDQDVLEMDASVPKQ